MYDVVVIGAGVNGCSIARELSRYSYKTLVLEKNSDICEETSKANSGIVHAGFDAEPGTLMAKLNVLGNAKMEQLARDLDIPFRRNGSLVLCFEEEGRDKLQELLHRGEQNGVQGLKILSGEETRELEPGVSRQVVAALYAPSGGIVCPFGLTIALAENACENGVEFLREKEVSQVEKRIDGGFRITTTDADVYESRVIINAAGVYGDKLHNMVCKEQMTIVPRKGEYCLFDKKAGEMVSHTIFQLPTGLGKGVLVTPTVHGNLLAGPTAMDIEDKENVATTADKMEEVLAKARLSIPGLPVRQIITSFAGLRAHRPEHEFYIKEATDAPGFIDVVGMESPGLTAAPAVGEYVADMVRTILPTEEKTDFKATRKGIPHIAELDLETRQKLIEENPAYANVVCRCELVTEGEIVDAIHRPCPATTVDGIKRRTRAGMGRCQAGFCNPKTVEILARELHKDISEITKCGPGSEFIL